MPKPGSRNPDRLGVALVSSLCWAISVPLFLIAVAVLFWLT